MKIRLLKSLMCALGFAYASAVPLSAVAQYKWKGSDGVIVYSDRPPEAGLKVTLLATPSTVGSVSAAVKSSTPAANESTDSAGGASKRRAASDPLAAKVAANAAADKAKEDAKKAEDEKQLKRQCELMKQGLATFESGQRIAKVGTNGEREFYSDEDRTKRAKEIKNDLSQHCKT